MSSSPLPKFDFMSTIPLLGGAYVKAAMQYFPFTKRHSNNYGILWQYGMELVDGGLTTINNVFENYTNECLMYGSPEENLEQIKIFMDFPTNNNYFRCDASNHYYNTLKFYSSHNDQDKKFICKNDLFLYLQNKLASKEEYLICRLPMAMLSYFFKSQEKKLDDSIEFVHFDDESAKILEKELIELAVEMRQSVRSLPEMGHNLKKIYKKYKSLLPVEMSDEELFMVHGVLKDLLTANRELTLREAELTSAQYYNFCAIAIPRLHKMIIDRPQWFLPNAKMNHRLLPTKPVIRLFIDEKCSFLFSRDLAAALKTLSATTEIWKDETEIVDTVDLETAEAICDSYGISMDQIELIEIPVIRAKHCAQPIPSGTGVYCETAADVFLELFRDLFFDAHNIFQHRDPENSKVLMKALNEELGYVFNPDFNSIYLINETMSIDISLMVAIRSIRDPSVPKENIRKVSSKGFTPEDVKKELNDLGYTSFFKDAIDYVEMAYKNVDAKKKEKVLRTCDMYDAIENCLMLSVCKMFPNFVHFLHSQKACHRIHGLQCKHCTLVDQKQLFPPFFCEFSSTVTQKVMPCKWKLNEVLKVEIPSKDGSEVIRNPQMIQPETSENNENCDPKSSGLNFTKSCDNCLKTSEKCQRNQDNLKASQKKETLIEKELAGMKKELDELKRKEPKMEEILEKKYMERVEFLEKELKEKRNQRKENLEKMETLERKLAAQQKEIGDSHLEQLAEQEKVKKESNEILETIQNENLELNQQQEEKEDTIKQLRDQLKKCGALMSSSQ